MSIYDAEKESIIKEFFDIGSNLDIQVRVDAIKRHKEMLSKLLLKKYDEQVRNLIDVIDSLLITMLDENRKKARKKIEHIWQMYKEKDKLTLYDIRILICILYTSNTLEEMITLANKCLKHLEKYKEHEKYHVIKIALYNSLSYGMMLLKYNSNLYDVRYDDMLLNIINELQELTIRHDHASFPRAMIMKGVLLEDKVSIVAALKIMDIDLDLEETETYSQFFLRYRNIL